MKLWAVNVTYTELIVAETRAEAEKLISRISFRDSEPDVQACEVRSQSDVIDYPLEDLIWCFSEQTDITLGEALKRWGDPEAMKKDEELRAKLESLAARLASKEK